MELLAKKEVLIVTIFMLFFSMAVISFAQEVPVREDKPRITSVSDIQPFLSVNNPITFTIELTGAEAAPTNGLRLRAYLHKKVGQRLLLHHEDLLSSFSLNANEVKTVQQTLKLPGTLPEGNYVLEIVLEQFGRDFDIYKKDVLISSGTSAFVRLSQPEIAINEDTTLNGFIGVYLPKDVVKDNIDFKFEANSPEEIRVTPKLTLYDTDSFDDKIVTRITGNALTLEAGRQTSSLTLNLPSPAPSGVYAGELQLFDEENNPISNILEYRYVIRGNIARIENLRADRLSYKKGDVAMVYMHIEGMFDSDSAGEDLVRIVILGEDGKAAGESNVQLDGSFPEDIKQQVEINRNVAAPLIQATVIKDGKVLASEEVMQGTITKESSQSSTLVIVVALLVIIIIIFSIYRSKAR